MNKHVLRGLVAAGVLVAGGAANAAVDAAATSAITGAGADIATVGGAVFLIMVGIKLVQWIRRAL